MTREQKILLLRGFAAGKISIDDLAPKELGITIGLDGTTFFINDIEVSADELNKEIDKDSGEKVTFNVIIE